MASAADRSPASPWYPWPRVVTPTTRTPRFAAAWAAGRVTPAVSLRRPRPGQRAAADRAAPGRPGRCRPAGRPGAAVSGRPGWPQAHRRIPGKPRPARRGAAGLEPGRDLQSRRDGQRRVLRACLGGPALPALRDRLPAGQRPPGRHPSRHLAPGRALAGRRRLRARRLHGRSGRALTSRTGDAERDHLTAAPQPPSRRHPRWTLAYRRCWLRGLPHRPAIRKDTPADDNWTTDASLRLGTLSPGGEPAGSDGPVRWRTRGRVRRRGRRSSP